jgi:hypothetical protein
MGTEVAFHTGPSALSAEVGLSDGRRPDARAHAPKPPRHGANARNASKLRTTAVVPEIPNGSSAKA